jgi:hypothetical protein
VQERDDLRLVGRNVATQCQPSGHRFGKRAEPRQQFIGQRVRRVARDRMDQIFQELSGPSILVRCR